ncbi:MAG: hypothetical protein H6Q89_3061, partial [Myxococcaceae bacterium]|nr:hypothetical protein [Myxococcaceae bacterium]
FIEELTGSPLPTPRRPEDSDERSGVATPGSGSSESLMMGKTAAPSSAPRPPTAPPAAPSLAPRLAGPAALLVAAAAGAWLLFRPATTVAIPVPAPVDPVVAIDAGAVAVAAAVRVPEVVAEDAGAPVVAVAAVKRFAMPPADELEKLEALERMVQAKQFKDAVEMSDRTNRLQLSPVGLSYAAMLSTQASCGYKDQGGAQARYRAITEPSHRTTAKSFCAKYIDSALLTL